MVETLGKRFDLGGRPFSTDAYLINYAGAGRGVAIAIGPELTVRCPARPGQVEHTDPSGPLPPPPPKVTLPTPDTTSDFALLEAHCAPVVLELPRSGQFKTYQRAEIVARVRAPVGGRAALRPTFPFSFGFHVLDEECDGTSPCTACFDWGGGDVRRPGDPEESLCVSHTFTGISRFPFATGIEGRVTVNGQFVASATIGTLECPASLAAVQMLSAECDYVQVGAQRYQRHRITAQVSGEERSSLDVWFRRLDDDGLYSYFMPGCGLTSADPPCTPPEDCLVCEGWTGASTLCPAGNSVYRAPDDPPSAICTHTRYLFTGLPAGDHDIILQQTTAETGAFGETIRLHCPPPPAP